MATDQQILAAIASATALSITAAQMVLLIDRAIAGGLSATGQIIVQTSSRGTSVTFASLSDALTARAMYQAQAIGEAGIVGMPGSFVNG